VADKIKRLPGDVSHLQRLIGDHAPERGMPPARLQRWLNAMIVTAVLDRVRAEDGEPIFLLKGGLAMELRLQLRARATGDYDAAFRARTGEVIDRLDEEGEMGARTTGFATSWTSFWSKTCCTTSAFTACAKPALTSSRSAISTPGLRP
jgi:hypothetical protein